MPDVVKIAPSFQSFVDEQRQRLEWMNEALIPADPKGQLPSANEIDVAGALLPRALSLRPDLARRFVELVPTLPAQAPADALAFLERTLSPQDFQLVGRLIGSAYFLDPAVNRTLRYPGQEALGYEPDYDEIMELVGKVIDRGPIYVATPSGS